MRDLIYLIVKYPEDTHSGSRETLSLVSGLNRGTGGSVPVNNLVAGGHASVTCLAVVCVVERGVLNRQVQTTPGMIDKDSL